MKSNTKNHKNQIVKNLKGKVETKNGPIYWQYDEQAPMTLQGFLPFFSQYLETSGIFESWVKDCPLNYTSNNAPDKKDVLGTALLSVLSGHTRYAHASSLCGIFLIPIPVIYGRILYVETLVLVTKKQ